MSVQQDISLLTAEAQIVFDAIQNRRSIPAKQLLPDPIDPEQIMLLLEAANWAPSHGQTEPWRFTIYAGQGRQGLSNAFGEAYRQINGDQAEPAAEQAQRDRVWQAPVWIALAMQPGLNDQGKPRFPEWEELIAVGCAVQNFQIQASSMGLGSKWTSGAVTIHDHVAKFVGLDASARLLGFITLGKPANSQWPQGKRNPIQDKIRWVLE